MAHRAPTPELLQGTLDVMILAVVREQALHGYGIARQIESRSRGTLRIEEGSLYPALQRLARRGELASEWRTSATGRRAKFYRLTTAGRHRMHEQAQLWDTLSAAVSRVVHAHGAAEAERAPHGWE